jgi:hypothetical protein
LGQGLSSADWAFILPVFNLPVLATSLSTTPLSFEPNLQALDELPHSSQKYLEDLGQHWRRRIMIKINHELIPADVSGWRTRLATGNTVRLNQ